MPAIPEVSLAPNALQGRVIAVTGASDGIGRAVAVAAARHGAQIILLGRSVPKLEAVHASILALQCPEPTIAPLDLEKALARDYDQLAAATHERYGRLDGLVHAAGMLGMLAPIEHFDVPAWWRVLHVNLTAAFALTQVLLPLLRAAPEGSIVFTSSSAGRRAHAYWGAYAVSKAGIEMLSALLATELEGNSAIRANTLNPGPVRTQMRRQAYPAEDMSRLAAPEDVVQPFLWLLSASSRGVSGQMFDCQPARVPNSTSIPTQSLSAAAPDSPGAAVPPEPPAAVPAPAPVLPRAR